MEINITDCTIFADGLDHPEGLAFHKDGSLWAGGEAGQIYHINQSGKVTLFAETGGFNLGLAFHPSYEWLAVCDLKNKCVWKLDIETKNLSIFTKGAPGASFSIPNYPVFDDQGNLYVSDSGAFRQINGTIQKFTKEGEGIIWHNGPFNFANGMALSPKGDSLFVVCSFLPGIEKIEIQSDGNPGIRSVFATLPQTVPDGLAFDEDGNLLVSCYTPNAIYKISPKQEVSLLINDWEAHTLTNPTNIAFGGEGGAYLFATNLGRWHITKIPYKKLRHPIF